MNKLLYLIYIIKLFNIFLHKHNLYNIIFILKLLAFNSVIEILTKRQHQIYKFTKKAMSSKL